MSSPVNGQPVWVLAANLSHSNGKRGEVIVRYINRTLNITCQSSHTSQDLRFHHHNNHQHKCLFDVSQFNNVRNVRLCQKKSFKTKSPIRLCNLQVWFVNILFREHNFDKLCRFRRLKCDEGKPVCFRCSNSGIRCRGYITQAPTSTKKKEVVRQGLVHIRPAPPTLCNEPSYLNLSEQEHLYFQDFASTTCTDPYGMIVDTTRRTARSIESFFWTEVVLQESFSTPCIRHGIVAISALVRSFQMDTINPRQCQIHEQFALKQYGKTLQSTRDFIAATKCTVERSRILFIASIILAHFDCFYGNRNLASSHMQCARSLLTKETSKILDYRFVSILMSLDSVNYSTMGFESEFSYRQAIFGKEQMYIPEIFSSIEEAVNTRAILVTRSNNLYIEMFKYRFTPRAKIPRSAIKLRDYYAGQLKQWDATFRRSTWLFDSNTELTGHPVQRPNALRLLILISMIKLATSLNEPQSITDTLLEPFQYIVSYTRDIINYETCLSRGMEYSFKNYQ